MCTPIKKINEKIGIIHKPEEGRHAIMKKFHGRLLNDNESETFEFSSSVGTQNRSQISVSGGRRARMALRPLLGRPSQLSGGPELSDVCAKVC